MQEDLQHLFNAITMGYIKHFPDQLEYILDKNTVTLNDKNEEGNTLLHHAINYERYAVISTLLVYSHTNPNISNKQGDTPLLQAVKNLDIRSIQYLLNKPTIDPLKKDKNGDTALHVAVEQAVDLNKVHLEIVRSLIKHRTQSSIINAPNAREYLPIHCAAINGNNDIILVLIQAKSPLNAQSQYGDTPLHLAVDHAHISVIETLLRQTQSLDLNTKNQEGLTPLHKAILLDSEVKSRYQIITMLLKHGADFTQKNADNESPVEIAQRVKDQIALNILNTYSDNTTSITQRPR